MQIKVLILADAGEWEHIESMLVDDEIRIAGRTDNEDAVMDEVLRTEPDVVLIALGDHNMLLHCCQQLYLQRPKTTPLVLVDDDSQRLYQQIVQTGVHYVMPYTIEGPELVFQMKMIQSNEALRFSMMGADASGGVKSRVVMVFGVKSGLGKTTMAVNLAVMLAKRGNKVALVDMDLQFGDINILLGIETKMTIGELIQEQNCSNIDVIRKYMTHHNTGVDVLGAPRSPEFAEGVTSSHVEKIVGGLKRSYDYVILDTGSAFDNVTLSCFDNSTMILFVTGMDISALRNSKKGLALLTNLVPKDKIHVVVTKETGYGVKIDNVPRVLNRNVFGQIDHDLKTAAVALNQGIPLVEDSPESKVSKAIGSIAGKIDGETEEGTEKEAKKKKRPLFGKRR